MSKKSYKKPIIREPIDKQEQVPQVEEIIREPIKVDEFVEEVKDTPVVGTVSDCLKLNVRSEPSINANILCVLDAGSEVFINPETMKDTWLEITTESNVKGFCMRQYVSISL